MSERIRDGLGVLRMRQAPAKTSEKVPAEILQKGLSYSLQPGNEFVRLQGKQAERRLRC